MGSDPRVRDLGQVEDIDGMAIELGVDYDTVVVGTGGSGYRLTRAAAEEFAQLFIAACWEAADCGGRMAAENSDGDDGPVFITMNADPPHPPRTIEDYERAAGQ